MLKRTPLLLLLLLLSILMVSCRAYRSVVLNLPNCTDSEKRFPSVPVEASTTPFNFHEADDLKELGTSIQVFNDQRGVKNCSLEEYLEDSPTRAFMIIRRDTVLYEWYHKRSNEEDYFASFSMAKTFLGSMFGIALKEGYIKDVNDPVRDYLPELDTSLQGVTLQHLLNHTSGIDFPGEGYTYYSKSLENMCKKLKLEIEPGTRFMYSNGGSQLLSMALAKAIGRPLNEYMEEKIWQPIGASSSAYWSVDNKKDKNVKAFCCMNAHVRDYAKMGRLWLNKGDWDGEQIIPESWVEATLSPSGKDGASIRYANQMWFESEDSGIYFAAGLFGQYLYMYPKKDILIVKLSKFNLGTHARWTEFYSLVLDQL